MKNLSAVNHAALALGLAFLYLPLVIVVIYSFNASQLATVWTGFSTRWYGVLFQNERFLGSAIISLKVGLSVATLSTLLGTMAAFVLVRAGRFPGRVLFSGLIYAPLVMPPVITGLSLLLLFIGVGLDRGMVTIILAQTTLSMCFVCVLVASRLVSYDRSLDEAALDLGATPMQTFLYVTLPIISPAVISSWLLSFSMSLDDVVLASFTAGPNSTTLPLRIFSTVRTGVTPELNALASIIVLIVLTGALISFAISYRGFIQSRRTLDAEAEQAALHAGEARAGAA